MEGFGIPFVQIRIWQEIAKHTNDLREAVAILAEAEKLAWEEGGGPVEVKMKHVRAALTARTSKTPK